MYSAEQTTSWITVQLHLEERKKERKQTYSAEQTFAE